MIAYSAVKRQHICHEPLGLRVQGLVAGLCFNSIHQRACTASASPTATSEPEDSGHHDKVPVCNQNLPEAERSLYAVLPWPIYQEPGLCTMGTAQAVQATTVSLCCSFLRQGDGHPCTECLLACVKCSTTILKSQGETPTGGGASSPCVNAGASTPQKGEEKLCILHLVRLYRWDRFQFTGMA